MRSREIIRIVQFFVLVIFMVLGEVQSVLAQDIGEWTGRGWQGSSSDGGGVFFSGIIFVAIVGSIFYLINEGFPNFLPSLMGLILILVAAQFITGLLVILGFDLDLEADSIIVFILLLILLHIYPFDKKKKPKNKDGGEV